MRKVLPVLLAVLGCSSPEDEADKALALLEGVADSIRREWETWAVSESVNEMDGTRSYALQLGALVPPDRRPSDPLPVLLIHCREGDLESPRLALGAAEPVAAQPSVLVRFDTERATPETAREGPLPNMLLLPGARVLVSRMLAADTLRVQYSTVDGTRIARFAVGGLSAYMSEIGARCGWTPNPVRMAQ